MTSPSIIHVITKLDVGGAQTVVKELALAQQDSQLRTTVLTGTVGSVAFELREAGVTVLEVPEMRRSTNPFAHKRALQCVESTIQRVKADAATVIHAHSSNAGLVARGVGKRLGIPVVYTAHGWPFQPGAPVFQRVVSYLIELGARRYGAHIVCVSEADRMRTLRGHICPQSRLHLVPNGIGDPVSHSERRSPDKSAAQFQVLMVARFAIPKRQDLLMRAIELTETEASLVLIGDGPQLNVRRKHASTRTTFVGASDPLPSLKRADAFALISDYEGLSISLLEAMRSGLPIVINELPGLDGVIENGVNGLIVPRSPGAIAEAIDTLNRNRDLCDRLGSAAHHTWKTRFTRKAMADGYRAVYESALSL